MGEGHISHYCRSKIASSSCIIELADFPQTVRPDDSFFDMGGNSISAQYMLAGVKKRLPEVNVDIITIVRNPSLRAFAAEIDR